MEGVGAGKRLDMLATDAGNTTVATTTVAYGELSQGGKSLAGGGHEITHFRGVFFAWRGLDATGDIDGMGADDANGFGHVVGRKAAGEDQWNTIQPGVVTCERFPIDRITGSAKLTGSRCVDKNGIRTEATCHRPTIPVIANGCDSTLANSQRSNYVALAIQLAQHLRRFVPM